MHAEVKAGGKSIEITITNDKEDDSLLREGAHVIVQNVAAKPHLHGCSGLCESFDERAGRWHVRFVMDHSLLSLQPKNLRVRVLKQQRMQDMQLNPR